MIRILHVIGNLELGGAQAMIMNLYRNVDKNKFQFDFIVDHTDDMYYEDEIKQLGGKVYKMPTFYGVNLREIKEKWNEFFKLHTEYKILHSHVRSYASLYLPIAKKYGLTTIVHSHSTSNGRGIKSVVKKILQYPLRYQADYLFACSEESGRWLYGKKAMLSGSFSVVPNAIAVQHYQLDEQIREQYRRMYHLENKFVIGHVGRFHEAKNHMFLLQVFEKILKQEKNAMLVLVGDGKLREQIETKITQLGIDKNVILLGNRNDVSCLLQMMDVFVFPSSWEGLPVTIVEAQAASLPCIISEVITDEVILTSLVKKLALELGTERWAEEVSKWNGKKRSANQEENILKFDINATTKWLEDKYCEMYKE